ncbi:MAG TPA: ubiquinol oxidase subunit II [Coxiellaceae bacterium]|nr:ubiquinol oxidase subunit II [Coxiellaceae bacterium]
MIKFRHIIYFGCTLFLAGCLSGCHYAILNPKGIIAASEKKLFIDSIELMLIVVIPVIILSFFIPWHYRASNTKTTYRPNWGHSTMMEVIWWTIPCIIILVLAIMTWIYTHKLDPYRPLDSKKEPVMIEAIALDWKWLFIYPQYHVAMVNYMQVPVDQPVRLFITSDAPMNSLEIPQLAGQVYAMTGMQTKLNLMATEEGFYRGLSTNFSGDGFSGMNFKIRVSSLSDFEAWLKVVKQSPNHLTMSVYNQLILPSKNNPVTYFSSTDHGLFDAAIIKYMGPMPGMTLGYSNPPSASQE